MTTTRNFAIDWAEQGVLPDTVVRQGIRWLLRRRLADLPLDDCEAAAAHTREFVAMMDAAPVAPVPEQANEQHYELPPAFFEQVLGKRRKYSCCHWPEGTPDLDAAEVSALALTCERAGIADGQRILELGCGWGSLTLWMAERYPGARIVAVTNSRAQQAHVLRQARLRRLDNLEVVAADMNELAAPGMYDHAYDRVVSVEMFEHMRNYRRLLARIHDWLVPGGRFFMHIFCHRTTPYAFQDEGPSDWMSRHFFSGGIMPSDDLPLHFQDHLRLVDRWRWSGRHYERTCNAWLERMDRNRDTVMLILADTYGAEHAALWWSRWRMFFMACAELFAYDAGEQWWVGHYLFERPPAAGDA